MRTSGTSLLALASLCFAGCVATLDDAGSGTGALGVATGHCEVYGAGALASGDTLDGDIRDASGTPVGSWEHTTSALDRLVGDPDTLLCRINGSNVADVSGTGTWNGVAGHQFRLHVQDRGDPTDPDIVPGTPESQTLSGTRRYSPSRWADGELTFPLGAIATIPATMPVTEGNAGNHWTWLTFVLAGDFEPVRCMYRGGASRANPTSPADIARGLTVSLARCERLDGDDDWSNDPTLVAGSELEVASIELHVHQGSNRFPSRRCPVTTVSAILDITPLVEIAPEADYYRLLVWDPSGAVVHFADGDLVSGDLHVAILP